MRVISSSDLINLEIAEGDAVDWDAAVADFLLAATAANPPEQRQEVFYPHTFELSVFQPHDASAGMAGEP